MRAFQYPGVYLLEVSLVARILSVSPKTIYAWIRDRQIEAIRLPGGGIRIPIQEVADILEVDPAELAEELGLKPLL